MDRGFAAQQGSQSMEEFDLEAFADRFLYTSSPSPAAGLETATFSSLLDELLCDGDSGPQIQQRSLGEALAVAISRLQGDFLAQVWAPATRDDKLVLTTQGQPFSISQPQLHGNGELVRYRALSTGYVFPTASTSDSSSSSSTSGSESEFFPGLPGRVFSRVTPEWTPNVQYYDAREYLRVRDAARCNIRGSLAIPVVDSSSGNCLAVVELVSNVEKLDYVDEIGILCNALQAANLSSSPDVGRGFMPHEIPYKGKDAVFSEISHILKAICQAHKLPLAQTWIACLADRDYSCDDSATVASGSKEAKNLRLTMQGAPYYLGDTNLWGFHQACLRQVLKVGQGVVGRAFLSNQPSFKDDIQSFAREEYPLLHYARYFGLGGAVGIRLRSILTGADDYVLELFLPQDCHDRTQQQRILSSLSTTVQYICKSLRTLSSKEVSEVKSPRDRETDTQDESSRVTIKKARKEALEYEHETLFSSQEATTVKTRTKPDRRRMSTEKTVPLEVLQKHFAGSLKDAARSIGVCPTTLKRICRQYGISRWPSRKINKVSRSLMKLQGVIDSVEGVDRAVKLDNLNEELASTLSATANLTKTTTRGDHDDMVSCSGPSDLQGSDVQPFKSCGSSSYQQQSVLESFVKIETRVHGSSAAFSVLGNPVFTPPSTPLPPPTSTKVETLSPSKAGSQEDQVSPSTSAGSPMVTIKAKLGSDTSRFKLPEGFNFEKLRSEIGSRFRLDPEVLKLKYLDDDSEWVILSSDEDLMECMDVIKSTTVNTIKLAVQEVPADLSSPSLSSVNL